jgi:hypothetical protein
MPKMIEHRELRKIFLGGKDKEKERESGSLWTLCSQLVIKEISCQGKISIFSFVCIKSLQW